MTTAAHVARRRAGVAGIQRSGPVGPLGTPSRGGSGALADRRGAVGGEPARDAGEIGEVLLAEP